MISSRKYISIIFLLCVIFFSLVFSNIFSNNIEGLTATCQAEKESSPSSQEASSPVTSPVYVSPNSDTDDDGNGELSSSPEGFQTMLPETSISEPTTFVLKSEKRIPKQFDPAMMFQYIFGMNNDEQFQTKRL